MNKILNWQADQMSGLFFALVVCYYSMENQHLKDKKSDSEKDTQLQFKKEFDLKDIFAVVGILGVLGGVVYSYFYWHSFNLNVFSFLSFSEVIGLTIPHLLWSVVFCLALTIVVVVTELVRKRKSDIVEDLPQRRSKFFKQALGVTVCTIIACVYAYGYIQKPILLPFIISFSVLSSIFAIFCRKIWGAFWGALGRRSNSFYYFFVLYILFVYLHFLGGIGAYEASQVRDNVEYSWINSGQLKNGKLFQKQQKLKLIGNAGDHWFFLTMDNQTQIIVKENDIELLKLNHYKRLK